MLALLLCGLATPLAAHVKWFSDFSFADPPLGLDEALTPLFLGLAVAAAATIALLGWLERRVCDTGPYRRVAEWLQARRESSMLVMRIAVGVVLLLSWQVGTVIAPELHVEAWVGWAQFGIALLLLFERTVPLAGAGVLGLYALAAADVGIFHMLDYLAWAGAGWFLLTSGAAHERIRGTAIPALYLAVGFSLCWVALEKVFYPQWGFYILGRNPQLALGFDFRFFLLAAAFIEFALGYLLILGLLERPMALLVTLVFFTTTLVFGKTEVVGHTLLHGALIVFLLEGKGRVYPAPISFHEHPALRSAFAGVNFLLLLAVLMVPYAWTAEWKYRHYSPVEQTTPIESVPPGNTP